jgi:hypothetical protein
MPTVRMPWSKSGNLQLDLLDAPTVPEAAPSPPGAPGASARSASMVPTASLHEDANNPRTEVPEAELDQLADDIRQHGILQPIVVPPPPMLRGGIRFTSAPSGGAPRSASDWMKCRSSSGMAPRTPTPKSQRTRNAMA